MHFGTPERPSDCTTGPGRRTVLAWSGKGSPVSVACNATLILLLASCLVGRPAPAAVIVLDFEGVAPHTSANISTERIDGFYNGGVSTAGTSGPNYGVVFPYSAASLCLNTSDVYCSGTSRGGFGDPNSQNGALYRFYPGIIDVTAGFTDGFSFFYEAIEFSSNASVYAGLGGTGALLASFDLPQTFSTCPGFDSPYCPFFPAGIQFAGVAHSVYLYDTRYTAFDDLTFGSAVPGQSVPEPGSTTLAVAAATLAWRRWSRRVC